MALLSTLTLLVAAHYGEPPAFVPDRGASSVRVAQEGADPDPDEVEEDDGPQVPKRLVPAIGQRRILGKEGLRAIENRRKARESTAPDRRGRALERIRRNIKDRDRTPAGDGNDSGDDASSATGDAQEPTPAATPTPSTRRVAQRDDGGSESIDFEKRARSGRFAFEFSKAEIMDVVKAISNLTRRNFIIPEKIKSQRITILSPTKINAREAWTVFLSALEVNGITVVRSGKFYKLVEAKDAQKSPIPTCLGEDDECPEFSDYMVTILVRLEHIDASQMNAIVKSLVSKEGEVTVFAPSNALLISDYAPNVARVRRIISSLDVQGFDDELQIVKIKYATASEVSETVKQVFEVETAASANQPRGRRTARARAAAKDAADASNDGDDEVSISKIVADDRTNQIIVRANRRSFEAIKNLIGRIDVPVDEPDQGKVHVYYLENASAEDLASTLSSLSSSSSSNSQANNRSGRRTQTNSGEGASESAALFAGEVQVTSEDSTNSLIIVASPRDFRAMKRIIAKLDVPRRQVYVEAAILEVSVGGDLKVGTNWHTPLQFSRNDLGNQLGGNGTIGFIQGSPSGGISPTLAPLTDPASLLGVVSGSLVGIVGKGIQVPVGENTLTLPSFGVVLRALQSASNAQILSTPHILTTDNEEATIEVGQRIPFRRGTSVPNIANIAGGAAGGAGANLGGLGNIFSATDRIDVSLKLTLTPQINESDKIRLEIDQQIEDVVGTDPATEQPITANRAAKTVVVVDDQQTVVLGGLIRDRKRESENKIPILGDLPLIGWLFKSRTTELEKVNLVLVLTPYIIRESDDFQKIFERKIAEYEEFAAEFYGDTAEYRAYIDYTRKNGPFAELASYVGDESAKVENGGEVPSNESLVVPERRSVEFEPLMPRAEEPETNKAPVDDGEAPAYLRTDDGTDAADGEEVTITPDSAESESESESESGATSEEAEE